MTFVYPPEFSLCRVDLGVQGSRSVMRALASFQCGPGSILRLGVICGLSLLVLYSAPTEVFLRVLLRFSPLPKNQHLTRVALFTVSPISAPALKRLDT